MGVKKMLHREHKATLSEVWNLVTSWEPSPLFWDEPSLGLSDPSETSVEL